MNDLEKRTKAYLRQFSWYNRDIENFFKTTLRRDAAKLGEIDWAKMDADFFVSFIKMELVRFGHFTCSIGHYQGSNQLPVGVSEMLDAEQNAWRTRR